MSVMRIKDAQGNWQEVAALHGLPGTSVSITSISESTEDDGYSVVTFSDGKQLRIKNGSKGEDGTGGGGAGVLRVMCVPDESGQSFTADKDFGEIHTALASGQIVEAYVHGMGLFAQVASFSEEMVMFAATVSMDGLTGNFTLVMMPDGTNALTMTMLNNSGVVVNITTNDDGSFEADRPLYELYEAAQAGAAVYAHMEGSYLPVLAISDSLALFRLNMNGMTISITLDDGHNVTVETAPEAGGGGGGGIVLVNFTTEDGETFTADKTLTELNDAVANGQAVYMSFEDIVAPAQCINDTYAVFAITIPDMGDGGGKVTFVMMYDGTVTMSMAPDSGNGGVLRVVVEQTNPGECTSTMTASEIFAAVEAGQQVECLAFVGNTANVFLRPAIITPEMVLFGGVYGSSVLGIKNQYCSVIVTNNTHTYSFSSLDKLPNPEPLTINGTSYDGSEAVNIDIAAGGGDNKWTSFYTNANIGGTNRAEYKTDRFGRSFAFSAAMVEISAPAASSASWVDIAFWNDQGGSTTLTVKPGVNTTASRYRVYCYVDHGRTKIWCTSPVEAMGDVPAGFMLSDFNNEFVDANTINRVIVNGRASFPSNTYCSVWGVNA